MSVRGVILDVDGTVVRGNQPIPGADAGLAARTREAAPDERLGDGADEDDAVAAFLADDDRIDAIREQARSEARDRAAEWGLDDALAEPNDSADPDRDSAE